jgi:cytochrome c-type biogenesis protein CcmH/NrfG
MAEASEEGLGSKWAVVPMIVVVVIVVVVVSYIKTGLYTAVNNRRVFFSFVNVAYIDEANKTLLW